MSMMIGGADQSYERARPVLESLSTHAFRIEPNAGQAATAKLVSNLLAGVHFVAAAEDFALCDRAGVDPRMLYDVVGKSSGQSWTLGDRISRPLRGDRTPHARTCVLAEDVGAALEVA